MILTNTQSRGVLYKLDDLINPARSLQENHLLPIKETERGRLLTLHAGYSEDFIYDPDLPAIQITPHAPHEVVKYQTGVDVASGGVMRIGEDTMQNIVMYLVNYLGAQNELLEGCWNWGEDQYNTANNLDTENLELKTKIYELEVKVDDLEYELEQAQLMVYQSDCETSACQARLVEAQDAADFYAENPEDKPNP